MSNSVKNSESFDPYRLVVQDETGYAICILDENGHILTWNVGSHRLKGYAAAEVIGEHFSMFYSPEDLRQNKPDRDLCEATRSGRIEQEGWRLRKDGSRFWATVVITALRDKAGTLRGFGQVTTDVTARCKTDEELQQALHRLRDEVIARAFLESELRELRASLDLRVQDRIRQLSETIAELENASRIKDDFLVTISHELLTPLTSMNGWAHMLREGKLSGVQAQHALEVIYENIQTQKRLIEDLLTVSRAASGKLSVNPQLVNPAPIIEQIAESARPAIETKRLRLELDLDFQLGLVRVDPMRMQQMLGNLLTNAVKFTPPGGCIRVQLKRGEAQAIISVSDTGEGIAAEFLPYVFDRFRQSDLSGSRRHGGLGLGLSIVRHLVELHGGIISVHSLGRGQGSTFSVHLPMPALPANSLKLVRAVKSPGELDDIYICG
jgi:PAS domain S-box-containing protein